MVSTLTRQGLHLDATDLARVRRTVLSASTAKALTHNCAAGYAFGKLLGEQAPDPFAATTQGTAVHSVLEELYKLPAGKRTRRRAANILLSMVAQWRHGDFPQLRDPVTRQLFIADVIGKYQGIFDIEDPREADVVATEWALRGIELGGVPFIGFVDLTQRVTARGRTGLRPVDHKTSNKIPDKRKLELYGDDHGDQIRLYAAGLRKVQDEPVIEGRVNYTRHGKSRIIAVSEKRVAQTVGEFARAWDTHNEMVQEAMFPTQTGPLCGWCPLVNLCPAAQASKFNTDRTDSQTALCSTDLIDIEPWAPSHEGQVSPTGVVSPGEPGETTETSMEGLIMAEHALAEDKPWEEVVRGKLNGASYAATGYFGISSLAYELLGTHGVPIQRIAVDAMTNVLASIVTDVQEGLSGSTSFQEGTNTRIRGVLRTVLVSVPPPFGEDAETWATWIKMATGHTRSIAAAAVRLAGTDEVTADIDTLASIAPMRKEA
ncbi:RecB family exonuclease [Brachybacterium tyrofermentans]|uniref:RecB family exonuclease n=1 Tax=Brachybacterium tyrofermentans TaxID=47848 RepID=UPI003FD2034B